MTKKRGKRYDKCEFERKIVVTRRKRGYANISETITNYDCLLENVHQSCVYPARFCRHMEEAQGFDECEGVMDENAH